MKYLLDTNICVFCLRGKFDVDAAIDKVGWDNCYISEITVLESADQPAQGLFLHPRQGH